MNEKKEADKKEGRLAGKKKIIFEVKPSAGISWCYWLPQSSLYASAILSKQLQMYV